MSYELIDFMSQSEIHYLEPDPNTIVISIRNPGMPKARVEGFKDVLFLEFHHTETLSGGLTRFSLDLANQVFDFVEKYQGDATKIVVNCLQGESRSAAIAYYLSEMMDIRMPLERDTSKHSEWVYHVLEKTQKRRDNSKKVKP